MGPAYLIIGTLVLITVYYFIQNQKNKLCIEQLLLKHDEEKEYLNSKYSSDTELLNQQIENLNLLTRVTEQSVNAVMLMDPSGNILWVNRAFERLYEYTFSEFTNSLGKNIRQTSFNPLIHERLKFCSETKQPITYEALNVTRSGKQIWTQTSLLPLVNDSGNLTGLVTIDSDVHQRIQASEEMSRFIIDFSREIDSMSEQVNLMIQMVDVLFERIEKSQERINKTGQIVGLIKEISDKIKILGINASIEAYAAGNHGKGFRIISGEIVSVSNEIITALHEICKLLDSVKRSSEKLGIEKESSGNAIENHKIIITNLKSQINSFETAIKRMV